MGMSLEDLAVSVLRWQISMLGTVGGALMIGAAGLLGGWAWMVLREWRRWRSRSG